MTTKVYDTMILVPEDEYLMLKGKHNKPLLNDKNNNSQSTVSSSKHHKVPGVLPEQIEQHNSTYPLHKEQTSTNWGLLWEPL